MLAIGIIISALLLVLIVLIIFLLLKKNDNNQIELRMSEMQQNQLKSQAEALKSQQELFNDTQKILNDNLQGIMKTVNENLNKSQGSLNVQLANTSKVINDVQKKLGELEQSTKNMEEIGKDIASLQDILRAPKLRGNLGEYLLEDLLKQIFPTKNFEMQYKFKNGTMVDAIIKLGEGIVPIDSKFPLESFQRLAIAETEEDMRTAKKEFIQSAKKRIDEIASKYINPDENTFDFAMIYIPAENVFYETIINDNLTNKDYEIFNYAIQKHVIPVSPNSLYAYLMAITYGLRGFKIEKETKRIIGELGKIQTKFTNFYKEYNKVGDHIDKASNCLETSNKKATLFNNVINRITGTKISLDADNDIDESLMIEGEE